MKKTNNEITKLFDKKWYYESRARLFAIFYLRFYNSFMFLILTDFLLFFFAMISIGRVGLLLILLIAVALGKKILKVVNLNTLAIAPGTIFLTKFDIGTDGNFTINYRKKNDMA